MSPFTLHLWREWRAHRAALLAIALVLPLATGLAALALPGSVLDDPFFAPAVALGFALVLLVVVGGELLGSERRGLGLRWLERLPEGLAGAFRAKLAFFGLALPLAMLYGTSVARSLAFLRDAQGGVEPLSPETLVGGTLLVLALGAWTFSASAWALRGGLAVLAAAVVLAVVGLPVQGVLAAGYRPAMGEILGLAGAAIASALLAARLGFVHGASLGRGPGFSALLGLVPALPVLLGVLVWSAQRLEERVQFDPEGPGFNILESWVSADGGTAFVLAQEDRARWVGALMPMHALRIDLAGGDCEELGLMEREYTRYRAEAPGRFVPDELVLQLEGRKPLAFDLANGSARAWDASKPDNDGWTPRGLGVELLGVPGHKRVIHDPFRERDFRLADLGESWYSGTLLVRPGRWLYAPSAEGWSWLDPETNARERTDWPPHSRPLVLLEDGRILLADAERGLRMIQPELGLSISIDAQGIGPEELLPNPQGRRVPGNWRASNLDPRGTIVVASAHDWLVIDEESLEVRRIALEGRPPRFLRLVGGEQAIVCRSGDGMRLARLDFASGALQTLWPRRGEE